MWNSVNKEDFVQKMNRNKRGDSVLNENVYLEEREGNGDQEIHQIYKSIVNEKELKQIGDLLSQQYSDGHYDQRVFRKRIERLKRIEEIENSQNLKVHNHLQNNFHLGNKKALFHNLNDFMKM